MKIKIIGTESLGVRGLCCSVTLKDRKVLIDPGIALGYQRHGHLPHPFQIAIGAQIRQTIINELADSTDVVFSHFDGDHVPLANANPFQLSLDSVSQLLSKKRIWAKSALQTSNLEQTRRTALENSIRRALPGVEHQITGAISFSSPVRHGLRPENAVSVMMTRFEEDGLVFLHASDVQLIHEDTIEKIIEMTPDIVLSSGPPLYLSLLSETQRKQVTINALQLAKQVDTLIIDHHLMRSEAGYTWLKDIASQSGRKVICAAEFMHKDPLFLEAWREEFYQSLPVPENWHKNYKKGVTDLRTTLEEGWQFLLSHKKINHKH